MHYSRLGFESAPTILHLSETFKQTVERGRVDAVLIRATGKHVPVPAPQLLPGSAVWWLRFKIISFLQMNEAAVQQGEESSRGARGNAATGTITFACHCFP